MELNFIKQNVCFYQACPGKWHFSVEVSVMNLCQDASALLATPTAAGD